MKILMNVEDVALTMAQPSQVSLRLHAILNGKRGRRPVARWTMAALFVSAGVILPLLAAAQSSNRSTLAREVAFPSVAASAHNPVVSVHSQHLEVKHLSGQTFQLVQSPTGFSFDTGRYYFHARAQQANGLYRGIQIYSRRKDPMIREEIITAYARFGRQDKNIPSRWTLGDVVLLTYDKDGTYKHQSSIKHLIIDVT